jgi:hypothetical protein
MQVGFFSWVTGVDLGRSAPSFGESDLAKYSEQTVNEKNLKPFKKGQSGNPKGRPKKLPSIDKLMIEVLGDEDNDNSEAKAILEALVTRAKKGDTRAAEILLDRGWGKSKQPIETDGEITVTIRHES